MNGTTHARLILVWLLMLRCNDPFGRRPDSPVRRIDCGQGDGGSTGESSCILEDQILIVVNQRRSEGANCGGTSYPQAPSLSMNVNLRLAARRHSQDMAAQNYFSHTSADGRTFGERIRQAGYNGSCPCGENIAAGPAEAEATMRLWMNSPGHCSNIMNSRFRTMGVGYGYDPASNYRHYWTQDFGAD